MQFQVLVDSAGGCCVLSHTDTEHSSISTALISYIRGIKWSAAKEKGRNINTSVIILFEISNDKLEGSMQAFDPASFGRGAEPEKPVIYNKQYHYLNSSLSTYDIEVWNTGNSGLIHDMSVASVTDKNDILWYATYGGLMKFDGKSFTQLTPKNSPFSKDASLRVITSDSSGNVWCWADNITYQYDQKEWKIYDSTMLPAEWPRSMTTGADGEVFLSDEQGLFTYKNKKWTKQDQHNLPALPDHRVYFTYRDKKQRLWIGTYGGNIMIDEKGRTTSFDKPGAPLYEVCINDAAEDDEGNIYFSVFAYKPHKQRDWDQDGIIKYTSDGSWHHYNDKNSGLPANTVNSIFYDRFEKIIWIGTNEAGLVRFDGKDKWENYNSLNSKIPSPYIFQMSQDTKGNIYVSTFNGLVMIKKK